MPTWSRRRCASPTGRSTPRGSRSTARSSRSTCCTGGPYEPEAIARLSPLAPCAGAGAYRREKLLAVGGFDEAMFAYLEDVELGIRLRMAARAARWPPDTFAWHEHGAFSGSGSARRPGAWATSRGLHRVEVPARPRRVGAGCAATWWTRSCMAGRSRSTATPEPSAREERRRARASQPARRARRVRARPARSLSASAALRRRLGRGVASVA